MTTKSPTDTRRWCVEMAVAEFLLPRLIAVSPLNGVLLRTEGEEWGDGRNDFLAMICVPAGPSDETSAAAIQVVKDALGDFGHVFAELSVTPDVVIEREDDALYVLHYVRIEPSVVSRPDAEEY